MRSHAEARCTAPVGGVPVLSGSSVLTHLTVNGAPVVVGTGEVKINVLLGVLHINSTVKTATGVTQRAIWFENTLLPSSLEPRRRRRRGEGRLLRQPVRLS